MITWKLCRIVFRLKSPVYVGYRRYGNLMQTRPYVPARTILGALTSKITRDIFGPTTDGNLYRAVGETLSTYIRFTYLYPALKKNSDFEIHLPWENPEEFYHKFIGSYVSTSLQSGVKAAEEGSLHEAEFISPKTRDKNEQVYLLGYVFVMDAEVSDFIGTIRNKLKKSDKSIHDNTQNDSIAKYLRDLLGCTERTNSLTRTLALGGERGYGWGKVECVELKFKNGNLFHRYPYITNDTEPILTVPKNLSLPAHVVVTTELPINGPLEPLVRKEWGRFIGSKITFDGVAYIPGSKAKTDLSLTVGPLGYCKPHQS